MTFTSTPPTEPGDYRWRQDDKDTERHLSGPVFLSPDGELWANLGGTVRTVRQLGGEWCRLVPAEEIEKAWDESREVDIYMGCVSAETPWEKSRAKRVMEGRE